MGRPSVGAWQLVGPSKSDFPDILTFSGAQYFTSGRVTALAIDPELRSQALPRLGWRRRRRRLEDGQCAFRLWSELDICVGQLRHERHWKVNVRRR